MEGEGFTKGELLDGKYRIERPLGFGGMGAVYKATHLGTKRTVAVKVIHPRYSSNAEFVERFRREAEAAGRLRHPNVVDVTDFGFAQTAAGQVAYLVMEYLDGCTLADVLAEESRLSLPWVVDILEQVCSAVDEAHRLGIIHRDLKPDNIWLEPNRRGGYTIKVLDFGLVKFGLGRPLEADGQRDRSVDATNKASNKVSSKASGKESSKEPGKISSKVSGYSDAEAQTLYHHPAAEEASTLIKEPLDEGVRDLASEESETLIASSGTNDLKAESTDRAPQRSTGADDERRGVTTSELTRLGSIMGTPLYMSPEQWKGGQVDERSDIYSLGVIAYRMLAGVTPFTGNFAELAELHRNGVVPPIREKNRRVPKRMARTLMSALAKDPAERPASAAGFASALRAGLEGSGTLLRQAISLYSEHFPAFLKLSLLAYAPLVFAVAFVNFSDRVLPMQLWFQDYANIIATLMFLSLILTNLIAYFVVSAATVPIVVQSMIAPLRPVRLKTAIAALRRRWWPFTATSIALLALIFAGGVLLVIPGVAAAICYALYAPVVMMEGSGVLAALKRARRLMMRSWSTVLIITLLQFALPVLVWYATIDIDLTLRLTEDYKPKEFGFYFQMSGRSSIYQLLNIFVTPLTAIMTALLYLKTRQAGGESLKDAIEEFDALDIPRSKWQMRMRGRGSSATSLENRTSSEVS